jgi:hypothetical protein
LVALRQAAHGHYISIAHVLMLRHAAVDRVGRR